MKTTVYRFCDDCHVLEPDVVMALEKMTNESLKFIIEQANLILEDRKNAKTVQVQAVR
jgi:hypothetical protein